MWSLEQAALLEGVRSPADSPMGWGVATGAELRVLCQDPSLWVGTGSCQECSAPHGSAGWMCWGGLVSHLALSRAGRLLEIWHGEGALPSSQKLEVCAAPPHGGTRTPLRFFGHTERCSDAPKISLAFCPALNCQDGANFLMLVIRGKAAFRFQTEWDTF